MTGDPSSAVPSTGGASWISFGWLLRHAIGGYTRRHPLRAVVQTVAIATGVALGYSVHLINASALAEFSSAVRQVSGQADATITGPREGFDEALLARVAADPAVVLASPVVDEEVPVLQVLVLPVPARPGPLTADTAPRTTAKTAAARTAATPARVADAGAASSAALGGPHPVLRIVGIDPLRAALLAPQFIGRAAAADDASQTAAATAPASRRRFALLDDGLYLSPAALQALAARVGGTITVQVGGRAQVLTVAGELPAARAGDVVGAMDIGFAQWHLDRLGRLSRIDLALAAGTDLAAHSASWGLPAGVTVDAPDAAVGRVSNLSRAYRVNLNVLAMVALFTGAFLVFSLQSQAVLARRAQFAFLRVIGATQAQVERLLLLEGALVGALGSALGLAAGAAIAKAALSLLGGDLGGGYFAGVQPALRVEPAMALLFFTLGAAAATLGGWLPAREAAQQPPMRALKTGSGLDARRTRAPQAARWPLGLSALAALCLVAPSVGGVPVFAYLAIALLLVAAIGLKQWIAPGLYGAAARAADARVAGRFGAARWLAVTRLAANPRFAGIGAAGIVASFALMVAMLTMVASFRTSVDAWLARVLPADLYVRAGPLNSAATFSAADLDRLREDPGVARVDLAHVTRVSLAPQRAPVALLARVIDRTHPQDTLPLTGASLPWRAGMPPPVWVSESVVDLFGARVGRPMTLPLAGRAVEVIVLGVWRDYARQFGSVLMDVNDYQRLTGDRTRTDASLWMVPGARAADVTQRLSARLDARSAEFAEPGEIRAISLRIFDRSFAVTYVLQVAAIVIGLVGIAATFSAQAIARTREFGVLRHLGCTPRQILAVLAIEGLMVTVAAVVVGLAAGLAIAWVLVDVVNPQSFHWTMDFRLPMARIGLLVAVLLVASTLTAVVAGRRAVAPAAVLAVREDW